MVSVQTKSHATLYWIAGVCLAFFTGMAVTNGYVTENAVHSAVVSVQQDERGDCRWTLRRERLRSQQ